MRCPVCAHDNLPNARFCTYCGAELEPEPAALRPGQIVDGGSYRIIRPLGKGGMGAVYLAANTKAFDRQCVVKEVIEYYDPTDPQERDKAMRRFEEEARTLAALKHPGIPDIYAYFTEGGRNYLVMEYIQGADLSEGLTRHEDGKLVAGQPRPLEDVIAYGIEISSVLDYLSRQQPPVTHNDIKPANIILDEESDRTVLVDFGTAKTRYTQQAPGHPGRQHSSVYGTVGYAAPELYEGRAEPRSDVYALAATLYHLLTDEDPRDHPFQFPQLDALPEPVRRVLRQALDNDVEQRPYALEFGQRLSEALQALHPPPTSAALPQPITFPNGTQAVSRAELAALCVKHWDYATAILYDGSIAHWLRDALHDPVAARAAEQAVLTYQDRSAGLEYLIRVLDPQAMPAPQLDLITRALHYQDVVVRDDAQSIEIANTGGGVLHGAVRASAPWIEVPSSVRCPPGQRQSLPVVVDTSQLAPGKSYRAQIEIEVPGAGSSAVPVEVCLSRPSIVLSTDRVDLGAVLPQAYHTERRTFEVQNRGLGRADCQIEGQPRWLVLDPQRFSCAPGAAQTVALRGIVKDLPVGSEHHATLRVNVEGARAQEVQVSLRTGAPARGGNRLVAALAIVSASLVLLGAIAWFVLQILPLLLAP
ncbi:MAG: protein kinase [Anaerolineae bacterium]|nr:protein kinase [Anaerolineae bacterium]